MAQHTPDHQTLESATADPPAAAEPELTRSGSSSRLNAKAPEFVPRVAPVAPPPERVVVPIHSHHHHHHPIHVFHPVAAPQPPNPPYFAPAAVHGPPSFEYYGGFVEHEVVQAPAEPDPSPAQLQQPVREGLTDDIVQKITKQVEYYFSDINLATTEHLMRFITKDPEGFVPMSIIAAFKKIKALVHANLQLANALRTSSKLIVSEDGKRVRRQQPFTESDMDELQSRIVVAENLPDDHCYQNLMKVFSSVGSVRNIRTCYPQTPNGTAPATNRSAKLDMLFANKLHAFVEYETIEDAEKAIAELNDERDWRSGLRVRLLQTCLTKPGAGKGKKGGHDGGEANGEEELDASPSHQPTDKQLLLEDSSSPPLAESSPDHVTEESSNEKETGAKRGKGRGRGGGGGRSRGRGPHHHHHHNHNNNNINNNCNNNKNHHPVGTSSSTHTATAPAIHSEPNKQPPGPRMPDGTKGFTLGRGKPLTPTPSSSTTSMP